LEAQRVGPGGFGPPKVASLIKPAYSEGHRLD